MNCKFAVVLIGGAVYLLCAADGEDAPANDDLLCAPAAARRESQVREWFMCFFRCCPAARWCAHVLQYACGDGFINGARDVLQVGGGRLDWVRAAVYDCARFAGVAQLVEQRIRNAQVMGSSPFTGSRHFSPSYFAPLMRGFFYGSKDTLSCLPSSAIAILTKLVLYGVAPPRPSPYRTLHHP